MIAVMNPPYSLKYDKKKVKLKGVPLPQHPDLLFALEALDRCESGVFLFPHGTLFRSKQEGEIRRQIIESGHVKAIIGLPMKLFAATDIPTVAWVIDQSKRYDAVLIISAEGEYEKVGPKNRLLPDRIAQVYRQPRDVDKFSRLVPIQEIGNNDYNLNLPRYVQTWDPEPPVDLNKVESELQAINAEIAKTQAELSKMMDALQAGDTESALRLAQVKRIIGSIPDPVMPRTDIPHVPLTDSGLPSKRDQDLIADVDAAMGRQAEAVAAVADQLSEIKREMLEHMFV